MAVEGARQVHLQSGEVREPSPLPNALARPCENATQRSTPLESPMLAFVPDLPVILAFALATLVLAVTPGPDMALQLSRAINYGRAHGILACLGAMTGIMVHTTLVAFGISVLILAAPPAFLALKTRRRRLSAVSRLARPRPWRRPQARGGGKGAAQPATELSHRRRHQPAQPKSGAVLRHLPPAIRRRPRSGGDRKAVLPRRRIRAPVHSARRRHGACGRLARRCLSPHRAGSSGRSTGALPAFSPASPSPF